VVVRIGLLNTDLRIRFSNGKKTKKEKREPAKESVQRRCEKKKESGGPIGYYFFRVSSKGNIGSDWT
jgi:hypothetical protein